MLIVEDEALVAWDLRTSVESFGYRVCGVAATGSDAVRLADEREPDIVLMDVRLRGDMDGVEAIRRMCATRSVGVVFITGNNDDGTEARIRSAHPLAVILSKPVLPAALQETIDGLLDNGGR